MALIEHAHPGYWATDVARAMSLGRDVRNWRRVWKARYEVVYRMVQGLLDDAWGRYCRAQAVGVA
jgi:hypothetical protein